MFENHLLTSLLPSQATYDYLRRKSGSPSIFACTTEKRATPSEGSSGHTLFINIHDLDTVTAELARLLGITLADTTLPVLNHA